MPLKASIIIATYRRTDYLQEALASINRQDYPQCDYEIIIVDNAPASCDELRDLACNDKLPVIRYVHEPRNGATTARHAGVLVAKGEILVFIDDDVICPVDWLRSLLQPFDDNKIALVAGRVVLHYEQNPPDWIARFTSALSGLDYGSIARALKPHVTAYSCNMAIRSSVFYHVGGLNPCYYSDPAMVTYGGDGECGLTRKVYDAGFIVWYAPDAWLHHRVPASRMTVDYHAYRAKLSAVEHIYCLYRYKMVHRWQLITATLIFLLRSACHYGLMVGLPRNSASWIKHCISAIRDWESSKQALRVFRSRELRNHIRLERNFPEHKAA